MASNVSPLCSAASGSRYEFGDIAYGDYLPYDPADPNSVNQTFASANAYALEQSDGWESYRLTRRWYLRKVTDPSGNSLEYTYRAERRAKTCQVQDEGDDNWVKKGLNWYTSSVDPVEIAWSGNATADSPVPYRLRVHFTYASTARSDTVVRNDEPHECDAGYATQPLLSAWNQLSSIEVQAYSEDWEDGIANNGAWQTLRSYQLNQAPTPINVHGRTFVRNTLTSVEEKGRDGSVLRRTSFTYNLSNVNQVWLASVSSSWGGRVEYGYDSYRVSCSVSHACRNGVGMDRYPVSVTVAYNGVGNRVRTEYYYGEDEPGNEGGAVADDGGFLGFQEVQITHYALDSTDPGQALKWERLLSVDASTGAEGSRENPDPRRGKLARQEVWSALPPLTNTMGISLPASSPGGNGVLLQTTEYDWQAYWFLNGDWNTTPTTTSWRSNNGAAEYPPTWVRQEAMTVTLYSGGVAAVNATRQQYEPAAQGGGQYGNLTRMEEYADGVLQRTTLSEYFPNTTTHIVNRPARVRMLVGQTCVAEQRSSYDQWNSPGNDYRVPPTRGLLSERDVALTSCSEAAVVFTNDPAWQVERFGYDLYGNQTIHHRVAATDGSVDKWTNTAYDGNYRLFPVRRTATGWPDMVETASYYGVNAISSGESKLLSDPWAYWGTMAEWCDVNDLCVRQAYDSHGRRVLRWENVPEGAAWSSNPENAAAVRWDYRDPLNNPEWNDVTVSEWRAPRCAGNFVRRHYNGFGQLTQEQGPNDGWSYAFEGCGSNVAPLPEVDVDYAYDGLGRQVAVSVPHATTAGWVNRGAVWTQGYTLTAYDAVDRVTQTTAPNGEQTQYAWRGRETKVTGVGRNGDPSKVLRWTETDGLGNLHYVRAADSSGNLTATVTLAHDVLGNLTRVTPPVGQSTVITYDLGGRKVAMDDPDLGQWGYGYNRQGELVGQADACGNLTSLSYDGLGRLTGKLTTQGEGCPETDNGLQDSLSISYTYDGGHSADNRSRGQLTGVSYSDGSYTRTLSYNGRGQLASETLRLSGAPGAYTSSYGYDAYDRPLSTTYPDGEVVQVTGYNSRGMASGLASVLGGTTATLVDCVQYDAAGRLVRLRQAGSGVCTGGVDTSGVYVKHYYYGWLSGSSGSSSVGDGSGRYRGMAVGTQPGTPAGDLNVAGTEYHYDSFGNVRQHQVGSVNRTLVQSDTFSYDEQNRITNGYGQGFGWQANGSFTSFAGAIYGYNAMTQTHAVNTVNGVDLFDYNRNGSMSVRSKGASGQQRLYWDSRNQLQQVVWGAPAQSEVYGYDENGRRMARAQVSGGTTALTFYPFAHYEQRGSSSSGVTKYYFFAGERFAMRSGTGVANGLRLLYKDRISSTVHVTDQLGNFLGSTGYYAFGATLRITGTIPTDHRFTDQQLDGTGLYYYGARYYDPTLGQFLSPDTVVPEPTNVMDYNRYAYARGNPLKYNDPTGHCPAPPVSGDMICVAGFIPTRVSEGAPGGAILYEADNRDFSSDSTGQSSRFYVWIDADKGEFVGDPKDFVHPTVQLVPPQPWLGGGEHEPRDRNNYFYLNKQEDGVIYFAYSVVCAGPGCAIAPGPEGEILFIPNDYGSYDTMGNVEAFPNLEAYHWKDGELASPYLFRLQNFSQEEIDSGRTSFWTGTNMYDLKPGGHREFVSRTRFEAKQWVVDMDVEQR